MKIIISIVLAFISMSWSATEIHAEKIGQCPSIKIPCSCQEAAEIFKAGLNNDPLKVEPTDIEESGIKLSEGCLVALKEKMELMGTDYSTIFKKTEEPKKIQSFIKELNTTFDKSIKKFPISEADLKTVKDPPTNAVCAAKGVNRSRAVGSKESGFETVPQKEDIDGIVRIDSSKIKDADCLIYLPNQYITDGPDQHELKPHIASYLTNLLIESDRLKLAKDVIDNFIYEIDKFGYPIGGNRGFKLTRSQNNFIPTNIWKYFKATKDYKWLEEEGLPNAIKIIEYWNSRLGVIRLNGVDDDDDEERIEGNRWFANGDGPRKELWKNDDNYKPHYFNLLYKIFKVAATSDPKRTSYENGFDYNRVINVAVDKEIENLKRDNALTPVTPDSSTGKLSEEIIGHTYVIKRDEPYGYSEEPAIEVNGIYYMFTPKFFTNDRAADVSGFVNDLYGPGNGFVDEFVDAVHSIELYVANKDIAKIYSVLAKYYEVADKNLSKTYGEKVELYNSEAKALKGVIMNYLWDDKEGMIFNYSNHTHTKRTVYPFAGGAYAIWANLFDVSNPEETKLVLKIAEYISENLEGPDGYFASGVITGLPWDKPNTQAIQQGVIVEGLYKYSERLKDIEKKAESLKLKQAADRISVKYIYSNLRKWMASESSPSPLPLSPKGRGTYKFTSAEAATITHLYKNLSNELKEIFSWIATPLQGSR